ncbi:MAG: hypothetical protein R3308_01000, partial [Thiohalobacterales bacterium]|nr:hypothetical protein [Thiohalobacterales bacterium]
MNRYPVWKYILLIVVVGVGAVYALPNLYGEDPALQISAIRQAEIDASVPETLTRVLGDASLEIKRLEPGEERILVRFADTDTQLKAADHIKAALGHDYVVAFNLAPATPGWLAALNALPMYLGLDLRGGVHFLMEVDMQSAGKQAIERYSNEIRTLLREEKIRYAMIRTEQEAVRAVFRDADDRGRAEAVVRENFPTLVIEDAETTDKPAMLVRPSEQEMREIQQFALQQNIQTLRSRVNELGVAEPIIQQQGGNRIVVQLPGVQDTAQAKR